MKNVSITKEIEYKMYQIQEEAFLHFKDFVHQRGTEEMKQYTKEQLMEVFFNRNYTIIVPEYNEEDGLEYQCMLASL